MGLATDARITDSETDYQFVFGMPAAQPVAVMIDKSIPLSDLTSGQTARVSRVAGEPEGIHRLEEFGLRGGTRVQMFRRGNPCIVRLGGNKVCFRTDQLLRILVEPDAVAG